MNMHNISLTSSLNFTFSLKSILICLILLAQFSLHSQDVNFKIGITLPDGCPIEDGSFTAMEKEMIFNEIKGWNNLAHLYATRWTPSEEYKSDLLCESVSLFFVHQLKESIYWYCNRLVRDREHFNSILSVDLFSKSDSRKKTTALDYKITFDELKSGQDGILSYSISYADIDREAKTLVDTIKISPVTTKSQKSRGRDKGIWLIEFIKTYRQILQPISNEISTELRDRLMESLPDRNFCTDTTHIDKIDAHISLELDKDLEAKLFTERGYSLENFEFAGCISNEDKTAYSGFYNRIFNDQTETFEDFKTRTMLDPSERRDGFRSMAPCYYFLDALKHNGKWYYILEGRRHSAPEIEFEFLYKEVSSRLRAQARATFACSGFLDLETGKVNKEYVENQYSFQSENGVPRVVTYYLENQVTAKEKQQRYDFENMLSKEVLEPFYDKIKNDPQENIEEFYFPKFHLENIKELTLISPDSSKVLLFSLVKEDGKFMRKRYLFDLKTNHVYMVLDQYFDNEIVRKRSVIGYEYFKGVMNDQEKTKKYRSDLIKSFCSKLEGNCQYVFEHSNIYHNTYFWDSINEGSKYEVFKVFKLY